MGTKFVPVPGLGFGLSSAEAFQQYFLEVSQDIHVDVPEVMVARANDLVYGVREIVQARRVKRGGIQEPLRRCNVAENPRRVLGQVLCSAEALLAPTPESTGWNSTVEEARNAVSACRYPRLPNAPLYDPPGIRGDAPTRAARYWGLTQPEYYARADVWPLAPQGEILAIIQCEDTKAIENLPRILEQVKGIGVVLIGEGDLSQELGHPREYEHPVVAEAIDRILKICKDHNVPCGHPHPDAKNIERLIASGYRFLMPSTPRSFGVLDQGRKLAGRT
jgi:2-keto-3-deoxy-L-rhamnonate aldolase RhmA